jgi:hypothetical protein
MRSRNAEHKARRRKNAVVRAQHSGAQPTDALRAVPLLIACQHGGLLVLFDLLRKIAKLFRLFVTCLHLRLCELAGFPAGQERNQGLQFDGRFVRVVRFLHHQMLELPD